MLQNEDLSASFILYYLLFLGWRGKLQRQQAGYIATFSLFFIVFSSLLSICIPLSQSQPITKMEINFNFLLHLPQGGFTFDVRDACKAEKVNLSEACTIRFDNNNGTDEFLSIGNVTKGGLQAEPGIVGNGVCVIY